MQSFRTFVGIELPPTWSRPIRRLIETCEEDGDGVRWVPRENLHLTLKFLGDVENVQVAEVCNRVAEACEDQTSFDLSITKGGALPSPERPRTLVLHLDDPAGHLRNLASRLEDTFADLGFRREPRDYVPHVTVGRARGGES